MKTIVITGSSSGIGKATAKYFAGQGWKVAATMRTPKNETELTELDNISIYQLDVTDDQSIASATERILGDFSEVDVVLNNAGYAVMGAFEAATPEQIRRQFNTNVIGLMSVTQSFLPHFRAKKSGLFMNISSIGGLVTFPFLSLYHSTKWAVEGFSESLYFELNEIGIQVKIIEPGGVMTDFGGRSMVQTAKEGLTDYNEAMGKGQANFKNSGLGMNTADFLAENIFNTATDGKNQLRYLIGPDAEQLYSARKNMGGDAFVADIQKRMLS